MNVKPAWLAAIELANHRGPVLVNTSLRTRAFVRDTALAAVVRGPLAIVWHGWDPAVAEGIDHHPARFRWGLGRAHAHGVLTEVQRAALARWGVDPAGVVSLVNPFDPASVPERRAPRPMVLFLGRWAPGKGVVELVRAFTDVAVGRPALELVIAGDGPLRPAVLSAIGASAARDRISLAGWVDARRRGDLLARAAVLVLPSADEAAPLAVIEALAAGVPVVGTTTGAVPSLIGDGGIAVAPGDLPALTRALAAVVDHPPDMADAAARIGRDHTPAAAADTWLELVARAAGRYRNNP